MRHAIPATRRKSLFAPVVNAYIALVFLFLLRFGIRNARSSENWTIGDWLINYHAGFVRRGLLGEIFLRAAQLLPLRAPWLVLTLQLVCYLSLLLVFRRLVLDSSRSAWVVALLVAPATLSFPLFNAVCGFRKEILFFASLALLIYLVLYKRASDLWLAVYLAVALPIVILSHESIYFYIPYYFAALYLGLGSWRRSFQIFLVPGLLATGALLLATSHPGNLAVAQGVCAAAGYQWQGEFVGPCGGAIFALAGTRQMAHDGLLVNLAARPLYWLYPLLAILALLPVVLGMLRLRRFPSLRSGLLVLIATVSISGLLSIAILYYALDWGRFIYMHALAAAFLILMIEEQKQRNPATAELHAALKLEWSKAPVWALIAVYACCWNLPTTPDVGYRNPPLGLVWSLFTMNPASVAKGFLGPLLHRH